MKEIKFTCMADAHELDLELLRRQSRIDLQYKTLSWHDAWPELLDAALFNRGPDISEIGSSWLGSLLGMNALRPFTKGEIQAFGGPPAFINACWESSSLIGDSQVWAIPWSSEIRVILYRRDILENAGIDEKTAFTGHAALFETLDRLRSAGHPIPLTMPTTETVIHLLSSWIWGEGGNFRSDDGHKLSLNEINARRGMEQFYSLHEFFAPQARALNIADADLLFRQGDAAVDISGNWLLHTLLHPAGGLPDLTSKLGLALVPGVPFVGGTSLVIWRHTVRDTDAIKVIDFLTDPHTQEQFFHRTGRLPAVFSVLEKEAFAENPFFEVVAKSLKKGRSFHTSPRWAAVEFRISKMLETLWVDIFANPQLDLPGEIANRTDELVDEAERTILSNW